MGIHTADHPRTYASFFAGIGGLDHAVSRVFRDARPVVYVENDIAASLRLAAQMETGRLHAAPIWSDVTTFPAGEFRGRADMAIGGFPCQDISTAGKQAGIGGSRSGLFYQLVRTARALGCRYLFLENVSAITARGNLDAVLGELADLGYSARWGCLRASDVGAPHGRNRWWCLAWDREQLADATLRVGAKEQKGAGRPETLVGTGHRADGRVDDGHSSARVPERRRVEGRSAALEHAERSRYDGRPPEPGRGSLGRVTTEGSGSGVGATMADTDSNYNGYAERDREPERNESNLTRDGSAMADAGRSGRVQRELSRESDSPGASQGDGSTAHELCSPLPYWPPGPADRDGWAAILNEYPHLAPAVESTLCGVVDVGSGRHRDDVHLPCECNRGDRLRGLGNAVVPDCAEAALRLLWWDAFGERI